MAESMSALVPLLGQALLHFLWQGALIGVFAALLLGALAPVLTMLWPLLAASAAPVVATTVPAASAISTATYATGARWSSTSRPPPASRRGIPRSSRPGPAAWG